ASRSLIFGAAAILTLSLIILTYFIIKKQPKEQILTRHKQITFSGKIRHPSISPDGKFIAYISAENPGEEKVFVQDLTGGRPIEIHKDLVINNVKWSPDGSDLLISANNDTSLSCLMFPRLGGTPQHFPPSRFFRILSWSHDASRFACSDLPWKRILFVHTSTGDTNSIPLSGSFTWLRDIDWSPKGHLLLFVTEGSVYTLWTIGTDGNNQKKVIEDSTSISSPRWSYGGDAIYYFHSQDQTRDLMKIDVDPASGKPKGLPKTVQTGLQAGRSFSISRDNKHLVYTRRQRYSNLWLVSYENEMIETKQLTTGTSLALNSSISPDGEKVAFSKGDYSQSNISIMSIEGSQTQQLTFFDSYCNGPVWSPDGGEIAFGSNQGGTSRVWRISLEGGTPRPFLKSELSFVDFYFDWSPCEKILYQRPGNRNFHFLDPDTEEESPLVPNDSVGWMFFPKFSPDTKKAVVYWNRWEMKTSRRGLWIISLEDTSQNLLHSEAPSVPLAWSTDGKWIYFCKSFNWPDCSSDILMISSSGGEVKTFMTLPFKNITYISMHPGKKKMVCSVIETQSDVWLIENFDPEVK
ncbi:MAG: PD40 domain-containing protein, partial [Gemmatimonadota bacterium]